MPSVPTVDLVRGFTIVVSVGLGTGVDLWPLSSTGRRFPGVSLYHYSTIWLVLVVMGSRK